jgi:uncharacterized membrane protein
MEELIKTITSYIALGVETGAALLILVGACQALYEMLRRLLASQFVPGTRKQVLVRFGVWMLLGLEFELAADIIRSAISPTWNAIGQLAAIAAIRTGLNYFLERDIARYGETGASVEAAVPTIRAA